MGKNDIGEELERTDLTTALDAAFAGDPITARAAEGKLAAMGAEYLSRQVEKIRTAITELAQAGTGAPAAADAIRGVIETAYADMLLEKNIGIVAALYRLRWSEFNRIMDPIANRREWGGKRVKDYDRSMKDHGKKGPESRPTLGQIAHGLDKKMINAESPDGWRCDGAGVWRVGEAGERQVAFAPLVISKRHEDVDNGDQRWDLSWRVKATGKWTTRTIDRATGMDPRGIVAPIASKGGPVSAINASAMVEYLQAFEAKNLDRIPDAKTTTHLGWMPENKHFVIGEKDTDYSVICKTEGEKEIMKGWGQTKGTLAGWFEVIKEHVCEHPLAMLAIYAALVPPMLEQLQADGFTIDWSGESSAGKTTSLRVAGSVWGLPDKRNGVIRSWDSASDVGPTVTAAVLFSLPVILDDTQHMSTQKQRDAVGQMLYAIPNGKERTRGTETGSIRVTRNWRTCMLTTGEAAISSFTGATGARARVLCLRGSPFGNGAKQQVEQLAASLLQNYGHMGPAFLAELKKKKDTAARYADLVVHYDGLGASNVGGRIGGYVALLHLAAEIAQDAGLPGDMTDAMNAAYLAATASGEDADLPAAALREVHNYFVQHHERFYGFRAREIGAPEGGWLGKWEGADASRPHATLGIFASTCRKVLADAGYQVPNILSAWRERGWTRCAKNSMTSAVRIGDLTPQMVVIPLVLKTKDEAGIMSKDGDVFGF